MPVLTSPPLVGGAGKPVTGRVAIQATAGFVLADGTPVTTAPQQGVIRDGEFFDRHGNDPLELMPTPEGIGMRIVLEISEHGASRGEHKVSRVVAVPDVPTVAWADLVDLVAPITGDNLIVPSWASETLEASAAAAASAADADAARLGAVAAQTEAESAAQSSNYTSVTSNVLAPGSTPTVAVAIAADGTRDLRFGLAPGPQGLPGTNAVPADTAVAGYIATAGTSETKAALIAELRARFSFNARDYGAVGDGIADDTAALQAAFNAADNATASGRDATVTIPFGTYKVSSGLTLMSSLDARDAAINYTGATGAALTIGKATTVVSRRHFILPRLVCQVNTAAKAWSSPGIVGSRLVNLNACVIYSQFIQHFDEGMVLEGNQQGFVHCEVHPGSLWGNRRGLILRPVNGAQNIGWVNSNNIYAGRISAQATPAQFASSWGIPDDPDASLLKMEVGTGGSQVSSPNSNTFLGTSVEGPNASLYRIQVAGRYNKLINLRLEHAVGDPYRILYKSTATYNHIDGGYASNDLQEVFEAGSAQNRLTLPMGNFNQRSIQVGALTIPTGNVRTPITTWSSVGGTGATYNATTGEIKPRQGRWRFTATVNLSPLTSGASYYGELALLVNGAVRAINRHDLSSSSFTPISVEWTQDFATGNDLVQFAVATTSPSGISLVTSPYYCTFHGEYLG